METYTAIVEPWKVLRLGGAIDCEHHGGENPDGQCVTTLDLDEAGLPTLAVVMESARPFAVAPIQSVIDRFGPHRCLYRSVCRCSSRRRSTSLGSSR